MSGTTRGWVDAQIVAQSLTTGNRAVLLPGTDATYVPTGHLVYALDDGLFAVAFDADSLTVLGGPVSLVQGVARATTAASANYAVTRDGTLFYLAGDAGSGNPLAWVDRAGAVDVIDTMPPHAYLRPRLAPDNERVLVLADGDLWIYELESGRESRLTTDGRVVNTAGWTPSGAEVTYSSNRGSDGEQIWIQPVDGSGMARQLTALDGLVHFDAWAPDGRTFSAHRHEEAASPPDQLMVSFDGTTAEPDSWLAREFGEQGAVFSPDGRYVAYSSDQSGAREIYIRPFPGPGGQTTVSVGGGDEHAWAANGELFYKRPDGYMMVVEISTVPTLDVGQPRELFRRSAAGGSPQAKYSVTADGQRFLMSADLVASAGTGAGGTRPKVVVVLNWHQELLERVPVP